MVVEVGKPTLAQNVTCALVAPLATLVAEAASVNVAVVAAMVEAAEAAASQRTRAEVRLGLGGGGS